MRSNICIISILAPNCSSSVCQCFVGVILNDPGADNTLHAAPSTCVCNCCLQYIPPMYLLCTLCTTCLLCTVHTTYLLCTVRATYLLCTVHTTYLLCTVNTTYLLCTVHTTYLLCTVYTTCLLCTVYTTYVPAV